MRWGKKQHKRPSFIGRIGKAFSSLKIWQLAILLFLSVLVSASLLRLNSLGMDTRRTAVIKADESGNSEELKEALLELRHYVNTHMNTSLGNGFYLTQTYERDKATALEAAANSTNPNAAEYEKASVECREKWQGGVASFRNDYVKCVEERVAALGVGSETQAVVPLSDLYKVTYASPVLSLDPAGFSVIVGILLVAVIFWKFIWYILYRIIVKHRYKVTD